MEYLGKRISVLGLGKSGFSAAKLLIDLGAFVFVSDGQYNHILESRADILRNLGASVELGKHTETLYRLADEIVVSPGVPMDIEILEQAANLRPSLPIIPEIELGFRVSKGKIIGITGSNGKSTTVTLIGEILKAAGKDNNVVGNIGTPFCDVALSATSNTIHCIELSSFQLERIVDFRPFVACMLNLSADHLNRHSNEFNYFAAKERIFMNQVASDYSILSMDDAKVAMLAVKVLGRVMLFGRHDLNVTGCFVRNGVITMKNLKGKTIELIPCEQMGIPGPHNVSNACAAVACTIPFDIPEEAIRKALRGFKGLKHRLEKVGESKNVVFINDSKATNIDSLKVALESFKNNIILIAGGSDKGADFSDLTELVAKKVKHAILIGVTAEIIEKAWGRKIPIDREDSLSHAVKKASKLAHSGDIVLLSPGCASYDMFDNYEQRGEMFTQEVIKIIAHE